MFKPPIKENPIIIVILLVLVTALGSVFLWVYFNYFQTPLNPKQQAISTCTNQLAEAGKGSGIAYSRYENECVLMCQRGQLGGCK